MRVVSLTCSNTEIVCALGLQRFLVGVDAHSDHPAEVVERLPSVGPDLQIDVDAVAALKPDLVLASLTVPGHEKIVEQLEQRGLPFLAPEPVRLEDVYRDIRDIGAALGAASRADEVAATMERRMAERVAARAGRWRPKVLVEWWPKPVIVPGKFSWVTDLIELAGGISPLGHEECKSRPITDAEAAAMAPDAVVISWCGVPAAKYRPDVVLRREAWAETPALRNRAVHCITEAYLGRPGPRLLQGFDALAAVIDSVSARGVRAAAEDGT